MAGTVELIGPDLGSETFMGKFCFGSQWQHLLYHSFVPQDSETGAAAIPHDVQVSRPSFGV